MLAYCANPSCGVPLHSFAEGRLFQFEIVSISIAACDSSTSAFDEKPEKQTAQFWLCGGCATGMSLVLDPQKGLRMIPVAGPGRDNVETSEFVLPDPESTQNNSC